MAFEYPVYLDVRGVLVLVVGAGRVGIRKIAALVEAGARVRVVAPDVTGELDESELEALHHRPYERSDLDGVRLVVTATGVDQVDSTVAADATDRGIWVNAADRPADCSFILPAVARAGDLRVAVSSDGTSPAIASWLRDRISDEVLTPDVVAVAEEIATRRSAMQAAGESTEDRDWRAEIQRMFDARTAR
jgi:precorrin-2 dehydrogenase/sirohydrochlorin ferrochelatase